MLFLRMIIPPVLLGFAVTVLNGKFRVQAQASQTKRAVLLIQTGFFPYISRFSHAIELKSPVENVKNNLRAGLSCVLIKLSFVYQGFIVWFIFLISSGIITL